MDLKKELKKIANLYGIDLHTENIDNNLKKVIHQKDKIETFENYIDQAMKILNYYEFGDTSGIYNPQKFRKRIKFSDEKSVSNNQLKSINFEYDGVLVRYVTKRTDELVYLDMYESEIKYYPNFVEHTFDENQIKEYKLKKLFGPKEANAFLFQEYIKHMNNLALEIDYNEEFILYSKKLVEILRNWYDFVTK